MDNNPGIILQQAANLSSTKVRAIRDAHSMSGVVQSTTIGFFSTRIKLLIYNYLGKFFLHTLIIRRSGKIIKEILMDSVIFS